MERFVIEKFTGVATNPAEGIAQEAPHKATVNFDKAGGYRALPTSSNLITSGNGYSFFAAGSDGWAALEGPSEQLVMLNGLTDSYTTGFTYLPLTQTPSFIPGAGLLSRGTTFEYYAVDGSIVASSAWNSSSATLAAAVDVGAGDLDAGQYIVLGVWCAQTAAGRTALFHIARSATASAGDEIEVTVGNPTAQSDYVWVDLYVKNPGSSQYRFWRTVQANTASVVLDLDVSVTVGTLMPAYDSLAYVLTHRPGTTVSHKGRVYGVRSEKIVNGAIGNSTSANLGNVLQDVYRSLPESTVVYSELGYSNFYGDDNWFNIHTGAGRAPTALASSPGGLLVFYDTETHLMRGDPEGADFQVQLFSSTLGVNGPKAVATMGGLVFVASNTGDVYQIAMGMGDVDFGQGIKRISDPVFDPEDVFDKVGVDYERDAVIASTVAGVTYRFDAQAQQWASDPLSGTALEWLIANPDSLSLRYAVSDSDVKTLTGSLSDIELDFDALDLGDKNLMKLWRRIEVYTDSAYAGSPTCDYTIRGASGTLTGVDQGDGRWIFTFPRGVTGVTADLEFTFPSVTSSTVVEPPLVIEYAPRYRER